MKNFLSSTTFRRDFTHLFKRSALSINNRLFKTLKSGVGFTLIELLIIVAVLGVISVVSLYYINPVVQVEKGRDAQRKSDLSQMQKVLEQYYQDAGRYPLNPGICPSSDYRIQKQDGTVADWGDSWSPYINILPKDPGSRKYIYYVTCNGQAYYLYASLERGTSDPQACSDIPCPSVPVDADCGGDCNYGVTSPNVSP